MTLEEAMGMSSRRYAWAPWQGGKVFVGKLKYQNPYHTWEVRLHFTDERKGNVWPTIVYRGKNGIADILERELDMDLLNCPSWEPYEPGEYLHPDNNPSIINFR